MKVSDLQIWLNTKIKQNNLNLKPLLLNEITYESMTNKETQNLNMSASIFLTSSQKVNDALKFLENNLDEIKFNEFKKLLNINYLKISTNNILRIEMVNILKQPQIWLSCFQFFCRKLALWYARRS